MNYPYATYGQASQPYPQNQQAASYTCRPVTSREEAIAMPMPQKIRWRDITP